MKIAIKKQDFLFEDFHSDHYQTGFLNLCIPLVNKTVQELKDTNDTRFADLLLNNHNVVIYNLLMNLLSLSLKTLVANYIALKEKGIFQEETEAERLKSFSDNLKEPEIRRYILDQYPVLEKWLVNEAEIWLKQTQLISVHLENDYEKIQNEFFQDDNLGDIEKITYGLGDRHRGGKTVSLLEFTSGKKLIYKPRSLEIDEDFSTFLKFIDDKLNIGFLSPKIIRRETYGWVEFIENKSCTEEKEIEDYYYRKGAYLGVLSTLEATDFHYENIIASGAYPVLIDLESFFHPYFPMSGAEIHQGINGSVLRTGLLSSRVSIDDEDFEIGGLSDIENKEGILANMTLQINGENIEFTRDKGLLKGGKNIPLLYGEKKPITKELLPYFSEGFKKVYTYIKNNKSEIKSQLMPFFDDDVRVLFRNTAAYGHLLEESTHPKVLESDEALKRYLNILKEKINTYQLSELIVPHEEKDLLNREVPLFSTKVNSRHLWYGENEYLENFFDVTGKDIVFKKIDDYSDSDLKRQLWIIEASFSINDSSANTADLSKPIDPNLDIKAPSKEELLAQSIKVADYIIDSIHLDNDQCNWLVFKAEDIEGKNYRIEESFYDLFTGMPGEILFFTYLYEVTGKEQYKEIALKAFKYLEGKISKTLDIIDGLGLYIGWGSIFDLYTKMGVYWKDKTYFDTIEAYLETIDFDTLIKQDTGYSFVSGSAGFIVACANYYMQTKSEKAKIVAEKAANYLLSKATHTKEYIAWQIISKVPLSGLAHGASGFALAFSKLYAITKNNVCLEIVEKILNYEKELFVKDQNNWQDCRDVITTSLPDETFCSTAWSHGAPGIGLTRVSLKKLGIDIEGTTEELQIALKTTLEKGFGGKQSLTFGDFGNLELLLEYATYYDDKEVHKKLATILKQLINSIDEKGWYIGTKSMYSIGLMSGITGIGYQFLRMAYPEKVPSVLNGE